ncbi:MAG: RHS repeat-associated core domain-containing protein [Anaerovoracaceae bacterium]
MNTPNADIKVEKSEGNLLYTQTDAELPNEAMPISFNRVYNSRSPAISSFGMAFSHNYDIELISPSIGYTSGFTNAMLKDETGSIITFQKEGNEYISDMGMYYSIKVYTGTEVQNAKYRMLSKDNEIYYFNEAGKLIRKEDANGNYIKFNYSLDTGFLTDIVAKSGRKIELRYASSGLAGTPAVITELKLPDGRRITYSYNAGKLVRITKYALTGSDKIEYELGYETVANQSYLNQVKDGLGNIYGILYDHSESNPMSPRRAKVTKLSYPDSTNLRLYYDAASNETITKKYVSNTYISEAKEKFDDSFGNALSKTDEAGNITAYTYIDGFINSTKTVADYAVINNGTIQKKETERTTYTKLTETDNVVLEIAEDGSETEYAYKKSSRDTNFTDDLVDEEIETDADEIVISDVKYEYDPQGNETKSTDSISGDKTLTEYYLAGNFIGEVQKETVTDEAGLITTTEYSYSLDSAGNKTTITTVTAIGIPTKITESTVDMLGNEIYFKNEAGDTSTNTYDNFGRLVQTSFKPGGEGTAEITQRTYNKNGSLISETAKDGTITTYSYDNMNQVTSTTVARNSMTKTTSTIRAYENQIQLNTGMGTKTIENPYVTKEYLVGESIPVSESYQDNLGRTVREKANGIYTDYTYDKQGKTLTSYSLGANASANSGMLTANVYDENGNQTDTIINPIYTSGSLKLGADSIHNKTVYDNSGKAVKKIDPMGNATEMDYNMLGELIRVKLPDSKENETKFQYGLTVTPGALVKNVSTDALGNESIEEINAEGQSLKIADIGSGAGITPISTSYEYDILGNKTKETEAKGNYKTFSYDVKKRLVETNSYEAAGGIRKLKTVYAYDNSDNLISTRDYKVSGNTETAYRYTAYGYDPLGKMISFAEFNTSSIPTDTQIAAKRIQYTYTLDDQIFEIIYPLALTNIDRIKFNYNQYKWLTSIDVKIGGSYKTLRDYEYDNNGKVIEIKDYRSFDQTILPKSKYSKTSFVYDELERLIEQQTVDSSSSAVKEQYNLSYDKNGNILREKIYSAYQANAENGKIDETRVYEYNSLGRLIKMKSTDHLKNDTLSIKNYEYDKVGNRIEELNKGEKTSYSYNSLNQLRASKKQKEGTENTILSEKGYVYDLNGNEIEVTDSITGESRISSFDAEDRLSTLRDRVERRTVLEQTNEYNGSGQRIKKIEQITDEGTLLTTTKQKNYYYQGSSVLYTEDKVGTAAEQISSFNLLGLSDNIIATERPNASAKSYYFYNKDVRGSSSNILDKEGEAKASYKYDEFGNTQSFGNLDNEIAYTGGIYDKNTQLYYLNARYYNPEEGRFISQDIYRGEQEGPSSWNLYAYCNNNPVNYVDPSGHAAIAAKWGFYSKKQNYFAFNQNAPQKALGYYNAYDYLANLSKTYNIDTFDAVSGAWKLRFWKGLYGAMYSNFGVASGCEIGLYKNGIADKKRLRMRMSLYKKGMANKLFTRDSKTSTKNGKAWWLNAFKPGPAMGGAVGPNKLKMTGTIWFGKSKAMGDLAEALAKMSDKDTLGFAGGGAGGKIKVKTKKTRKGNPKLTFSWTPNGF